MTGSEGSVVPFTIERMPFTAQAIDRGGLEMEMFRDWPIVYLLDDARRVYVGESLHGVSRMRQHQASEAKQGMRTLRLVLSEMFNKSVCLDLESTLIRLFQGDGSFHVVNRNIGIVDAGYYQRERYREAFREIFEELRAGGMFQRTIPQIENSELYKFSPSKTLTADQAVAVGEIVESLLQDFESDDGGISIIQGDPGTGKTIVAVYLLKLLSDIAAYQDGDEADPEEMFSEHFDESTQDLMADRKMAFVVPQESLRHAIQSVFSRLPSMSEVKVLTAFEVGESEEDFDLVIVDEAHRLNQYAMQAHGTQLKRFRDITTKLFGHLDEDKNQLDWIRAKSRHVVLMLDLHQSVRPADIPRAELEAVVGQARERGRVHPLHTQMRAAGGNDYIAYVRDLMAGRSPERQLSFGEYEFTMFDDAGALKNRIEALEPEYGLCRMTAGFAWPWRSNPRGKIRADHDFELDGTAFRWNSVTTDWVNSPKAPSEVGSIHTLQGYDLNYAGVIIGPELRLDPDEQRLWVDRAHYADRNGKIDNRLRGQTTTDDDLLHYVTNAYAVLLTRGMRGTFVYVCDPQLRRHLERFIPKAAPLP
ncbi:DNA/RNA helicase domain-containing protein [Kocuria palustris]|uniref:DNA/RNA helicase domain-containing protein n=1 Tax=Kocuria palustris TaxID=71999 RepID=UPI003D719566